MGTGWKCRSVWRGTDADAYSDPYSYADSNTYSDSDADSNSDAEWRVAE